jgi:XRE family transcriptional regulator, aerobic/anaerobic benzoate catabolism transcriptional regulator
VIVRLNPGPRQPKGRPPRRLPGTVKQIRAENTGLLKDIGLAVRNERARHGATRKTLAQQCQLSERYLAQVELGKANPSVLVLDSIARALGLSPVDLMPWPGRLDPGRRELLSRLRHLPTPDLAALVDSHAGAEHADAPNRRARRIALIGLRGAGKSTLGAALAKRIGAPFIEIDKMIEQEHGAPVATLFEVYGHAAFRRYERECLAGIVDTHVSAVIATAGGIVADESTFAQLLDRTHAIWLQASATDHMRRVMEQGDFRPMARNRAAMNDLVAILDARQAAYGRSHARLETSGKTVEACVDELTRIAEGLFAKG